MYVLSHTHTQTHTLSLFPVYSSVLHCPIKVKNAQDILMMFFFEHNVLNCMISVLLLLMQCDEDATSLASSGVSVPESMSGWSPAVRTLRNITNNSDMQPANRAASVHVRNTACFHWAPALLTLARKETMLKECALSGYLFSVFIGSVSHFQSLLLHCDSDTHAVEESKRAGSSYYRQGREP